MTASKGIHDPWRLGTGAWKPPADEDALAGTRGSELPFDWDLQPEKSYVLRHQGVSLRIIGIDHPEGAVALLIRAYDQDEQVRRLLTAAGFTRHSAETEPPTGFFLQVAKHALACPSAKDARTGLHKLCAALREGIRADPSLKQRLRKLGIVPLTT